MIMCPSWYTQKTFDPIRHLVDDKDVWTNGNKVDFTLIHNLIKSIQMRRKKQGQKAKRFLILVDDMAGTPAIHGNRISPFAHLSVQTPHLDASMIVITQQPTNVSPAFRDNAENIVVFPSEGELEIEWLKRCYQSLIMEEGMMKKIILKAWRGGKNNNDEWGQHFLFIQALPRKHSRFWIDFKKEIKI